MFPFSWTGAIFDFQLPGKIPEFKELRNIIGNGFKIVESLGLFKFWLKWKLIDSFFPLCSLINLFLQLEGLIITCNFPVLNICILYKANKNPDCQKKRKRDIYSFTKFCSYSNSRALISNMTIFSNSSPKIPE